MKFIKYALISISLIALPFVSTGCGIGKRFEKKEISEYRINTSGKNTITLFNNAGNIQITRSDTAGLLTVRAEKMSKVRKRDLDKPLRNLTVTVDTASNVIVITGEKEKYNGSSFEFTSSRTAIDFYLTVPKDITLNVSNTNGKVNATNVTNDMSISVINGSQIFDNLSGKVSLDVNNGSITGMVDSAKDMNLHVNNGSVTLSIAPTYSGKVKSEVNNGKITREGLSFSDVTEDRKNFKGVLGTGPGEIQIEVINGKIKLTPKEKK